MRPASRASVLSAAVVLLFLASGPLAAAQGETDVMANFPNACRDVDPMDAVAHGRATPLVVRLNGEDVVSLEPPSAEATQAGPGKAGDRIQFLDLSVPGEEDPVVTAQILAGRVDLDVDGPEDGLEAEAWTNTRVVGLNVMDGFVTADMVRGFAYARSDVRSARAYTDPSTIVGLKIQGIDVTDIAPGDNVTLPVVPFGAGSYVSVYERIDHSTMPTEEHPFYVADVEVRMLHIHITDSLLFGEVEVIVSDSYSHAESPTPFCGLAQSVEASAYSVRIRPGVEEPGIFLIGEQHIGVTGGSGHQQLFGQNGTAGGVTVLANVTETDVEGTIVAGETSDSAARSRILYFCIMPEAAEVCLVEGTLIDAQVACHADADGADCVGNATIMSLTVAGVEVCQTSNQDGLCVPAASTVEQVGDITITFNEQERVEADGYEALFVRAVRIETHLPAVGTIILGRAYASAAFEHAGTPGGLDPWAP